MAEVLRAVQPDMKLIVMLRDPVARFESAFWYYGCLYNLYGNVTAGRLHELAVHDVGLIESCLEQGNSVRQCARQHFHSAQQLVKGMYAAFAPDWLTAYPAEQIMWIKAEDYYDNEAAYLQVRAHITLMSAALARTWAGQLAWFCDAGTSVCHCTC